MPEPEPDGSWCAECWNQIKPKPWGPEVVEIAVFVIVGFIALVAILR